MKKFVRNLFSGWFFVILILLAEVGAIIVLQFFSDDVISAIIVAMGAESDLAVLLETFLILLYFLLRIIVFIIGVIIFFKIINKPEDPEFKIPWIVGMLLLPFFFSMMFLIFGNHGLNKKDRIIIDATKASYNAHFKIKGKEKEAYEEQLGNAIGAVNYIHNTTKLSAHSHNKVTYYKNGETFFPAMIEGLKQAKEFIFMEFFIISDGKEWSEVRKILIEKAEQGVDVRLIYDDMGCSGTISHFTPRMLKKHGIKCYKFHPFKPLLSGIYNNRDHRKIVIIDHQMGFTGGINLADEYANLVKRFGYWKDTMVKIEGSGINNLIVTFLQNYNLCSSKVSDYNKFLDYDYPQYDEEGFVMPFGDGPGGIDDALIGEQTYINILNFAKKSCYISTPYLIPTYQLTDALRNAALRGVDVHLIVPGIPDKKLVYKVAQSNFRYLLDAGVHIYTYSPGFNHMKSALADDELAFVGTINFDFRSLVHHFECGTLLYKNPCLKEIREDFDEMISASKVVPVNYKPKMGTRWITSLIKIITPLL